MGVTGGISAPVNITIGLKYDNAFTAYFTLGRYTGNRVGIQQNQRMAFDTPTSCPGGSGICPATRLTAEIRDRPRRLKTMYDVASQVEITSL